MRSFRFNNSVHCYRNAENVDELVKEPEAPKLKEAEFHLFEDPQLI